MWVQAAPALTCGVPNGDVVGAPLLQVEGAAHRADRVRKAPLHVPLQQRRLSHVHVPQKHDLPVGLPHLPAEIPPPHPCARRARVLRAQLEQLDTGGDTARTRGCLDSRGHQICGRSCLEVRNHVRRSACPRQGNTKGLTHGFRPGRPRPRPLLALPPSPSPHFPLDIPPPTPTAVQALCSGIAPSPTPPLLPAVPSPFPPRLPACPALPTPTPPAPPRLLARPPTLPLSPTRCPGRGSFTSRIPLTPFLPVHTPGMCSGATLKVPGHW